jgi:hypothetical protein
LNTIAEAVSVPVQYCETIALVFGTLYDDTGESGEAYDAEAKADVWAKAQTMAAV